MPRCIPSWIPLLDRSLIGFCSRLGPPDPEKSSPAVARARFLKNRPSKLISIFDSILVPTCLHFGSQNSSKSVQKLIPRGIKTLSNFGSIFWSSWLHFGSQVGAQVANKTSRETSADRALRKMIRDATQRAPRRFPDGPKMLFQPSKMATN